MGRKRKAIMETGLSLTWRKADGRIEKEPGGSFHFGKF